MDAAASPGKRLASTGAGVAEDAAPVFSALVAGVKVGTVDRDGAGVGCWRPVLVSASNRGARKTPTCVAATRPSAARIHRLVVG